MSLSSEEYIQNVESNVSSHSNCDCPICIKESVKSLFGVQQSADTQAIINNMYYCSPLNDFKILPRLADVMKSINENTTNHFGDMEFALNEYGEPDGLKNEQEIVLTVASEVSEEVAEEVFNNIKELLFKNDHINELAMQLLKESKEK